MPSSDAASLPNTPAVPSAGAAMVARRRLADAAARWVVTAGGLATIVSIVGILVFICFEVYPLLRPPRVERSAAFPLTAEGREFAPATDEGQSLLGVLTARGAVRFVRLADGSAVQELALPELGTAHITTARRVGPTGLVAGTSDGRLLAARVSFDVRRGDGVRAVEPRVVGAGVWPLALDQAPITLLAASQPDESGVVAVFVAGDGAVQLYAVSERQDLFGNVQRSEARTTLPLPTAARPTTLAVSTNGRRAFVGTADGQVRYWDLTDREQPRLVDTVDATDNPAVGVTAIALLIGEQSLVVGDAAGRVSTWFPVRDAAREHGWRLQRVHVLPPHGAAVTAIAASPRDKRFLTADTGGEVRLHHATTEQTLLTFTGGPSSVEAVAFAPKANGAVVVAADGAVSGWQLFDPHPEVSLRALFGKVWYEGYERPAYVWQSTGGTDDFEPKLSLVPLIIGTMKGTLYALLFAVPIAVLAALYTSQFSHPSLRNVVKPTVEIMAALPSVVLGFLAGLWLAPTMERIVPATLAMVVVLPLMIFAAGMAWGTLPVTVRARLRPGTEVLALMPLIVVGVYLCVSLNDTVEQWLFGGDFRRWLLQSADLRYDQRNCLVVGFAMGFAVIPIIFTISEDALSNVPQRLISGSLALGATRWQTAMRVVLPTASPGIFSATMIGFGRAVGETMIVLMATGNTPVLDWNIFTGMRTLSANIAVEIPEAPHGGTLFRVLFLAGLLLFVATFAVNTAAEVVRQRLRRRYQQM